MKINIFFASSLIVISILSCVPTTKDLYTATPPSQSTNTKEVNFYYPPSKLISFQPDSLGWLSKIKTDNHQVIYGVAVSQILETLAVYTSSGIYLYDIKTWKQTQKIDIVFSSENKVLPITFSPDGNFLGFTQDKDVIIWDLKTNKKAGSIKSLFGDNAPFYIEFSPSGDRIVLSTYSSSYFVDFLAVNFALYNLEGDILFNKFLLANHSEYYYRLTTDGKLYVFFNSMLSGIKPLTVDIVDSERGTPLETIIYDDETKSYTSETVFYDITSDGQIGAVQEETNKTKLINIATGDEIDTIEEWEINFLPHSTYEKIDWDIQIGYRITGFYNINSNVITECQFGERPSATRVPQFEGKLILLVPDFYEIEAIEIWDIENCKLERGILFSK
jgi:WD40 repeat protein